MRMDDWRRPALIEQGRRLNFQSFGEFFENEHCGIPYPSFNARYVGAM